MSIARRSLIGSIAALVSGCSPAAILNTTVPKRGYALQADIPYGDGPRRTLDLYTPEQPRADGKAVIFFYGGSWDTGKKGDYLFVAQALASRGITVIVPDYRLYPEIRFPTFLEDSAHATRWAANKVGTMTHPTAMATALVANVITRLDPTYFPDRYPSRAQK